jgi:hypothetical protein
VAVLLLVAPAMAASSRTTTSAAVDPDWLLAVAVRRALQQDPVLAPLNLGVTVSEGTATVWGVVPSPEVARRVESLLRQVRGVKAVRSNLQILRGDDPLKKVLAPALPPRPVPALLNTTPAGPTGQALRAWQAGPTGPPGEKPEKAVAVVTPPLAVPVAQTAPVPISPVARPVAVRETVDLASAVEKLRQRDPRYLGLRVEVRGGVVRLSGSAGQAQDVMELATAVSLLPGVKRVLVDGITAGP